MSKLNITEGEWIPTKVPFGDGRIYHFPRGKFPTLLQFKDNGLLICDAANTYQKKPILPSKLLEDRERLIAFVVEMKERYSESVHIVLQAEQLLKEVEDVV